MRNFRWVAIAIIGLGLIIRLVWGLTQLSQGVLAVSEGDFTLYEIGAQHIASEGDFSNSLFLVRPPLYSLWMIALNFNYSALIISGAIFGALTIALTILLCKQLQFDDRVALIAGLWVALDPSLITYNAFLGPEAMSFAFALAMFNALLALKQSSQAWQTISWAIVASLCLLISAYARPSIYLIWTGLSIWLLIVDWRKWMAIALFAILSFGGIQAWAQHNGQVFGNPTFSTISAYTMTYYRALSVLYQATDMSLDEAYLEIARRVEAQLGRDPELATPDMQHGYLAASPEVEDALTAVSLEIFLTYPQTYLLTLGVGIVRYFELVPQFPPLENLTNPANYPLVLWNWAILIFAILGIIQLLRERRWFVLSGCLLVMGYFTAGTLLVKSAGMTGREKAVMLPVMLVVASYGVFWVYGAWQKRRNSTS